MNAAVPFEVDVVPDHGVFELDAVFDDTVAADDAVFQPSLAFDLGVASDDDHALQQGRLAVAKDGFLAQVDPLKTESRAFVDMDVYFALQDVLAGFQVGIGIADVGPVSGLVATEQRCLVSQHLRKDVL